MSDLSDYMLSSDEEDDQYISVSAITNEINSLFQNYKYKTFYIKGEVTNYRDPKTHLFFGLRDESSDSQISCASWRGMWEQFPSIRNGDLVKIKCRINYWKAKNSLNLLVTELELCDGESHFYKKYEELKEKYSSLGYFDEDKKQKISLYNKKIGLVTSIKGAALRDAISVIRRRSYGHHLIIRNTKVQGKDCEKDIKKAIEDLNKFKKVDVIIVTRGGGSIEDLWGFNSEEVIEAVFKSKIPIVSAIGHQFDTTLCDLVADKIAPTPTAAAEIITQDKKESINILSKCILNLESLKKNKLQLIDNQIQRFEECHFLQNPINEVFKEYDLYRRYLDKILSSKLEIEAEKLNTRYVNRFPIIMYKGEEITSIMKIRTLEGKEVEFIFEDGSINATLTNVKNFIKKSTNNIAQHKEKIFKLQIKLEEINKISKTQKKLNTKIFRNILEELESNDIFSNLFCKNYEKIHIYMNTYQCHIEEMRKYQPKIVESNVSDKQFNDYLKKLTDISKVTIGNRSITDRFTYFKKGQKYLSSMKRFLEILEQKFNKLEGSVSDYKLKNLIPINEISKIIDEMFDIYINNNEILSKKFYDRYLKLLFSISKHKDKIENSKIEIVQLVNSPHGSGFALKNENSNFE